MKKLSFKWRNALNVWTPISDQIIIIYRNYVFTSHKVQYMITESLWLVLYEQHKYNVWQNDEFLSYSKS
jgi:hypothetical protein